MKGNIFAARKTEESCNVAVESPVQLLFFDGIILNFYG